MKNEAQVLKDIADRKSQWDKNKGKKSEFFVTKAVCNDCGMVQGAPGCTVQTVNGYKVHIGCEGRKDLGGA